MPALEQSQSSSPKKPDFSKTIVMIGTPCYGGMMHESYLHCFLKTLAEAKEKGYRIHLNSMGNESLITRARNTIVSQFLDRKQLTHLLFIDADIAWQPETITRMLTLDEDVVAGIYPRKTLDWYNIEKYVKDSQNDLKSLEQRMMGYNLNFKNPRHIPMYQGGFVEVLDAATGFMMIKREVILKMIKEYPELKYTTDQNLNGKPYKSDNCYAFFDCMIDPDSNRYLSEDYTFCRRWQKIGGKIYADVASSLTHYGTYHFRGNVSHKFAEQSKVDKNGNNLFDTKD
jgi:hypothetical protein